MSIITITLNNKDFQLACTDGSENELQDLARRLNEKITNIKLFNKAASFELLLVMSALSVQEEVQSLEAKLRKIDGGEINQEEEKFSETLSTIAGYLENLAKKIAK